MADILLNAAGWILPSLHRSRRAPTTSEETYEAGTNPCTPPLGQRPANEAGSRSVTPSPPPQQQSRATANDAAGDVYPSGHLCAHKRLKGKSSRHMGTSVIAKGMESLLRCILSEDKRDTPLSVSVADDSLSPLERDAAWTTPNNSQEITTESEKERQWQKLKISQPAARATYRLPDAQIEGSEHYSVEQLSTHSVGHVRQRFTSPYLSEWEKPMSLMCEPVHDRGGRFIMERTNDQLLPTSGKEAPKRPKQVREQHMSAAAASFKRQCRDAAENYGADVGPCIRDKRGDKLAACLRDVEGKLRGDSKGGSITSVTMDAEEKRQHLYPRWPQQYSALYDSNETLLRAVDTDADRKVRYIYEIVLGDFVRSAVEVEARKRINFFNHMAQRALESYVMRALVAKVEPSSKSLVATKALSHGIRRHIECGKAAYICELAEDEDDRAVFETTLTTGKWDSSRSQNSGEQERVAVSLKSGIAITYRQLSTLAPGVWLNDQIINAYLGLICDEYNVRAGCEAAVSMGTHFYAKVQQEMRIGNAGLNPSSGGFPTLEQNSGVLRWLKRRRHILQSGTTRIVLVPVNLWQSHWTLAVLDWERNRWTYYDSLLYGNAPAPQGSTVLGALHHTFEEARRILCDSDDANSNHTVKAERGYQPRVNGAADQRRLTVATPVGSGCGYDATNGWFDVAPQQQNSSDCGVFVCHVAWCVVNGVALTFTQEDVTALRRVMLHELLLQRLLRRLPLALYTKA